MLNKTFQEQVQVDVQRALEEDVGGGDLTASLVPADRIVRATIICREAAIICGQPWVNEVLKQISPSASSQWFLRDGEQCQPGQKILEVVGAARELLTAERTCLNWLQTLSAVATKTASYVKEVEGTGASILDTRKTIPGLRFAQKYAVRCGGGTNHRMGLFDAILIKENHIAASGSVSSAYKAAQAISKPVKFIQVEVETIRQLEEAIDVGAKMVLLDNMNLDDIREAVKIAGGRCSLEISGAVKYENLRAYAETGVDRISVGALIKDITAIDFSMRFLDKPVER